MLYELFGYGPDDFAVDVAMWVPDELGAKGKPVIYNADITDVDIYPCWLAYCGDFAGNEISGWITTPPEELEASLTEEDHAAANAKALAKYPLPEEVVNGSVSPEEYLKQHPGFKKGGLNAVSTTATSSGSEHDEDEKKVTVTINAEDSTNGLFNVEYDAAVLKLESVKGLDSYSDYNTDAEGKAVVDFAAVEAVNDTVATLVFSYEEAPEDRETIVKVTTAEDGEEKPGTTEEFPILIEGIGYVINATAGENGEISPAGEFLAKAGSEVEFTVTPAEGFAATLLVNGEQVALVDNKYTLTVKGDTSVKAFFAKAATDKIIVKLIKEGEGEASVSVEGEVDPGTEVTVNWAANVDGHVLDYIKVNGVVMENPQATFTVKADRDTVINVVYRILHIEFYNEYWYENGIIQGTYDDPNGVRDTTFEKTVRGREIFDPATNAWYWLDSVLGGKPAKNKEVSMPYIYQSDVALGLNPYGKWVRYDGDGQMIKGWYENENGRYYYDLITGAMAKGVVTIEGVEHEFDSITGVMIR
jgi:hypothetical protein